MAFDAYWIPEPESWTEFYPPDVGVTWLRSRSDPRVLVVPTLGQADYVQGLPSRVEVTTPRSRYRRGVSANASILVCFPYAETLELADELRPSAVCIADNGNGAVRGWVAKHEAAALVPADWEGDLPSEGRPVSMPEDVQEELRFVIDFDGHNQFVGAGGKREAIRALRRIHQAHPSLDLEELEAWLLSQPEVRARGAQRLRSWLEEIRKGVRHQDYNRRPI